jgi:hypothetical protein
MGIIPANHWPMPVHKTLAAVQIPRALPTFHFVSRGLRIERRIRALHPAEPHLYVYVVGVRRKGEGRGAALMRQACALAKSDACKVHLETGNPINLPFYRRFDLEVVTEITDHGGPPVWTMTQTI